MPLTSVSCGHTNLSILSHLGTHLGRPTFEAPVVRRIAPRHVSIMVQPAILRLFSSSGDAEKIQRVTIVENLHNRQCNTNYTFGADMSDSQLLILCF